MLDRGRCEAASSASPHFCGLGESTRVVRLDRGFHFGVEFHRPVVGSQRIIPVNAAEVVHDVSAAQNQDSALAQRLNLAPKVRDVLSDCGATTRLN